MNLVNKALGREAQSRVDAERYTMWTAPWAWRSDDGIYIGFNGEAWFYQALTLSPMQWEDHDARLGITKQLTNLLADLGGLSKESATGLKRLATMREIHLLSITWWDLLSPPELNSPELRAYQAAAFGACDIPNRCLLIGVKLDRKVLDLKATGKKKTLTGLVDAVTEQVGEDVPDVKLFQDDLHKVKEICKRYNSEDLSREQFEQLESWFNQGRGVDVEIQDHPDKLVIHDGAEYEVAAVRAFEKPRLSPGVDQWILDALAHPGDSPQAVSIRATLEPTGVTRGRSRMAQRRIEANMEEEEKSGDLEKRELTQTHKLARDFEDYLTNYGTPMLSNVSFLFARELTEATETYMDFLANAYGIRLKPLVQRQLPALEEFLPTSPMRVNPFLQDVNIPMVAQAGLPAFSELGEDSGAFVGMVDPDGTPLYIDPRFTSRQNLPPVFGVFGDPGSGKTFFAQNFVTQVVKGGEAAFFINPKGASSLYGMCDYLNLEGDGSAATRMSMSALEKVPGAFDPFRFAKSREDAAEIAAKHLLAPMDTPGDRMDQKFRLSLESGLKYGARAGVDCVWDALEFIVDETHRKEWKNLIQQQMDASSLFALGVAKTPRPRLSMAGHLNLVDFDRDIGLPPPNKRPSEYTSQEWIAIATIGLVTKAAIEILLVNGGGVLVLDEAWTFLQIPEALSVLDKLAREGRSQGILPVFLTQKVKDVITGDLAGYMSRVLVLKMDDAEEAETAVEICGLEPTPERLEWLRSAGPKPPKKDADGNILEEAVWATGIFSDPRKRHAAVALGPTPEAAVRAWSTNPDDVAEREAELRARGLTTTGAALEPEEEDALHAAPGEHSAAEEPSPAAQAPAAPPAPGPATAHAPPAAPAPPAPPAFGAPAAPAPTAPPAPAVAPSAPLSAPPLQDQAPADPEPAFEPVRPVWADIPDAN